MPRHFSIQSVATQFLALFVALSAFGQDPSQKSEKGAQSDEPAYLLEVWPTKYHEDRSHDVIGNKPIHQLRITKKEIESNGEKDVLFWMDETRPSGMALFRFDLSTLKPKFIRYADPEELDAKSDIAPRNSDQVSPSDEEMKREFPNVTLTHIPHYGDESYEFRIRDTSEVCHCDPKDIKILIRSRPLNLNKRPMKLSYFELKMNKSELHPKMWQSDSSLNRGFTFYNKIFDQYGSKRAIDLFNLESQIRKLLQAIKEMETTETPDPSDAQKLDELKKDLRDLGKQFQESFESGDDLLDLDAKEDQDMLRLVREHLQAIVKEEIEGKPVAESEMDRDTLIEGEPEIKNSTALQKKYLRILLGRRSYLEILFQKFSLR